MQPVENMTTYKYESLPPVVGPRNSRHNYPSRQLSTRLLTIYGGEYEDDIEVDLEVIDLNGQLPTRPMYDAMSYVWGCPEMVSTVYVGKEKKTVKITANLDEAIRHMRYPDRPRTMWIDGLCIDQENIEERGRQVAYMCHIFWGATRVVIWLGKAADNSDTAMKFIRYVASRTQTNPNTGEIEGITEDDEGQWVTHKIATRDHDVFHYTLSLFQRPWFERIWVRQEVNKAGEQSLVACGTETLSWMAVRRALICLIPMLRGVREHRYSQACRNRLEAARHLITRQSFELGALRFALRGIKCTDPRDRVYGLLGILDRGHYLHTIVPDYSKSVSEVYRSVVLECIATTNSVAFLVSCHKNSREELSIATADAIPTWVPDWAHPDSHPDLARACLEVERKLCPFQSSAKYLGSGVLRVAGVSYGTVVEVLYLDDSTLEALATSIRTCTPPNAADTQYPGGGNLFDAFCVTLSADHFFDNNSDPSHLREGAPVDWPSYEDSQNALKKVMDKENISMLIRGFLDRLRCRTYIGRFFITDSGYLGWSPSRITEGDQVTGILGCQAPMILRPSTEKGNQFEVIGPSYTHGASYGSAFLGPLPSNLRPVRDITSDGPLEIIFHDFKEDVVYLEDPRLERLPVDLTEYREKIEEGLDVLLPISPETWRAHGVDVVTFDLI